MREKRENFIESLAEVDPNNIIVIDESGSDLRMTKEYSRAEGGGRIKAPKPFKTDDKYSLIGAISIFGIVAIAYLKLAVNADVFMSYVKSLALVIV